MFFLRGLLTARYVCFNPYLTVSTHLRIANIPAFKDTTLIQVIAVCCAIRVARIVKVQMIVHFAIQDSIYRLEYVRDVRIIV